MQPGAPVHVHQLKGLISSFCEVHSMILTPPVPPHQPEPRPAPHLLPTAESLVQTVVVVRQRPTTIWNMLKLLVSLGGLGKSRAVARLVLGLVHQ